MNGTMVLEIAKLDCLIRFYTQRRKALATELAEAQRSTAAMSSSSSAEEQDDSRSESILLRKTDVVKPLAHHFEEE